MSTELLNYIVALNPDENNNEAPSYLNSIDQLNTFLEIHGGEYKGWHITNMDEFEGCAVVSMTSGTSEKLQTENFVEPNLSGNSKNIHRLEERITSPLGPFFSRSMPKAHTHN